MTIYGAHAATTTFACLAQILAIPEAQSQLPKLLGSYVPFFLVPAGMMFDFGGRLNRILSEKTKVA